MNTSADAPYLERVYKLQEYDGRPRRKRSQGKATWPGRKQVVRRFDGHGFMAGDVLTTADAVPPGEGLLREVMRNGRRLEAPEPLETLRRRAQDGLARLPESLRSLSAAPPYPVTVADTLRALAEEADRRAASSEAEDA